MRFNIAVALVTLVAGLGLLATEDTTSWSRGYGYDGRLYGDLAQHFPGAVFGHEGVTPPGYGPYKGPRPQGIDAYYVRRILPSAVVYYSLTALGMDKTHGNVIACFGVWNALMIALSALLLCLCADRVGLGRRAKLVGLCGLLVNFAILKNAFYFPVFTDIFAFGLGALSLYFWVTRRTAALAVVTFLNAFTWPTSILLGAILLLFPVESPKLERRPLSLAEGDRRATLLKIAAAAIPAIALLAYLIHLRALGYQPAEGIPLGGAFALAAITAAAFVFAALIFLIPDLPRAQLRAIASSLLSWRLLLVVAVVGGALISQAAIAKRPAFYDEVQLLRSSIWYSALNPGLFLVTMVGFFGPLLALAIAEWPRVCRKLQSFGPGAVLVAVALIGSCLLTEPRKSTGFYPFIVFFVVLACERIISRRWFAAVFVVSSIVISRVWLPIGKFGLESSEGLRNFPAQRYFLSSGIWTSFDMYLVQLAAVVLLVVLFLAIRGSPNRSPDLQAAIPAGGPRT